MIRGDGAFSPVEADELRSLVSVAFDVRDDRDALDDAVTAICVWRRALPLLRLSRRVDQLVAERTA